MTIQRGADAIEGRQAYATGPGLERASSQARAMRAATLARARRHSRRVRRLRWVLPALSLVLVVSFWGSASINALLRGANLGFGALDLTALVDGELVMAEPDISGTINGRRFEVTAARAIQDVTQQDEVRFESPVAVLDGPQGRIDVSAGEALYAIDGETLALSGGVDVTTARGQTARLEDARVDLATGNLVSDAPVTLDAPQGRIEALGVEIEDSGKRVLFTGRVRARFTPSDGGAQDEAEPPEASSPETADPISDLLTGAEPDPATPSSSTDAPGGAALGGGAPRSGVLGGGEGFGLRGAADPTISTFAR